MTCEAAHDALLDGDLPVPDDSSELARHLQECDACARVAAAVTRGMALLRVSVRRRARTRRRIAIVAAVAAGSTVAAAAVVVALIRLGSRAVDVPATVNAAPVGVVSVQVAPGTRTAVLLTKDPRVTVVWLSSDAGGGL